ncbi:MAG: Rieske 2Fe-2S domain-containing protein [Chloroflexi bacterium]|nr:Rieske 2Fe-2S domain-containing protein [Chloroflexota bacterium]MBV9897495.1 Rieske 2Fe-2S domain-containing protein [Chloroflexota bacterium]
MLTTKDNETVCRVGPDTPMGKLMREYWVPALLSRELPSRDSDPVRVMLLGEKLIAFRDTNGAVGLIQNHCPHRGASLFFGRNEESGLRCVYHGWKFAHDGTCVDMPNEPAESDFRTKVKAVAYPTQERGGIVWAYLGPRATPPPLPDLEANMLPEGQRVAQAVLRECNWLQALEGDIDTSHLGFLHHGAKTDADYRPGTFAYYAVHDRAPRYQVVDTEYGAMYAAYRPAGEGQEYWRYAQFLFPFYVMIPSGVMGLQIWTRAWVPMDDEHVMFYSMHHANTFSQRGLPLRAVDPGASTPTPEAAALAIPMRMQPNTTDWFGRFRLIQNASNDYLIDRDKQRRRLDYTGIPGIHQQDQAVTESMGTIFDRTQEHLGSSDVMLIRVRRRLLAAAEALASNSVTPPGVDHPEAYAVRGGGALLPRGADWLQATAELRKAFVDHPELDPTIAGG